MKKQDQSRRNFIKKGTAALAGMVVVPTIIPASAMGRSGFTPPSDRIEMALIGCGGMGRGNATSYEFEKQTG